MSIFNTRFGMGSSIAEVQRNSEAKRLELQASEELAKAKADMTAAATTCDIGKIAGAMSNLASAKERKAVVDAMAKAACEGSFDTGKEVKSVEELFTLTATNPVIMHRVPTPPVVSTPTSSSNDVGTSVKDAVKTVLKEERDDVLGGIKDTVSNTLVEVLRDFEVHLNGAIKTAVASAIAEEKANAVEDKQEFINALSKSIEEGLKKALEVQVPI